MATGRGGEGKGGGGAGGWIRGGALEELEDGVMDGYWCISHV